VFCDITVQNVGLECLFILSISLTEDALTSLEISSYRYPRKLQIHSLKLKYLSTDNIISVRLELLLVTDMFAAER
jgi:hypothetical protein